MSEPEKKSSSSKSKSKKSSSKGGEHKKSSSSKKKSSSSSAEKLKALQQKLDELYLKLNTVESDREKALSVVQAEFDAYKADHPKETSNNDNISDNSRITDLAAQLAAENSRNANLQEELKKYKEELSQLKSQNGTNEIKELKSTLEEARAELRKVKHEADQAKGDANAVLLKLQEKQNQEAELKQTVQQLQQQLESLDRQESTRRNNGTTTSSNQSTSNSGIQPVSSQTRFGGLQQSGSQNNVANKQIQSGDMPAWKKRQLEKEQEEAKKREEEAAAKKVRVKSIKLQRGINPREEQAHDDTLLSAKSSAYVNDDEPKAEIISESITKQEISPEEEAELAKREEERLARYAAKKH